MSDRPIRIQLRRTKGWRMPENTISVGRPGKWGNPFVIDMANPNPSDPNGPLVVPQTIEECVSYHRTLISTLLLQWPDMLEPLRGKNLACWCPLDQPCHADVLLEFANR